MPKLQDCQFIQISIDNKELKGSSEEEKYKNWFEGYSPVGLATSSGPDGAYFEYGNFSVVVTKDASNLYEKFLSRGYKQITITIVHRGSNSTDKDYEIQRCVYKGCNFSYLNFVMDDNKLFISCSFRFDQSVVVTFNVPNADGTALDKIGPITYDIPQKTLK